MKFNLKIFDLEKYIRFILNYNILLINYHILQYFES